jgi:acyl-CoA synthetase (AMP-forming)/AMP-acid ligase II
MECGLPPLPFNEISVRDESGDVVPTGTIGEISVRSPSVTTGYWNDPVASRAAIEDGWLATGDGGYLDRDGCLHVVGRRSDLIVTGGENVYPAEVEAVLDQHPAVAESCVVGLPDADWGSRVVAVAVRSRGPDVSDADLEAHARSALAGYKVPREVIWRTAPLPRTAAGKLRRREVREALG